MPGGTGEGASILGAEIAWSPSGAAVSASPATDSARWMLSERQ
jgi:hypothetical protein